MGAVGLSASQQQFVRRGRLRAHGGVGKPLRTRLVESKKGDRREGEAYDRRWTKDICWRER